jgi:hypothetical protein
MAITFKHADGPGKISGTGQNGTPAIDFERMTTGQLVVVSVDFMLDPGKSPVCFEIIAGDGDAEPLTPNKTSVAVEQHVYKRAIFRVTKEADAAIGVVEVPFEVNFTSGKGTWQDFTMIGETTVEH